LSVIEQLIGECRAHSLAVDSELIRQWVIDVWSEVNRFRTWSHLRRRTSIIVPERYTTGTATYVPGSTTVTFAGSTLSASMIGRQLRRAAGEYIYDITDVDVGAGTCQIWPAWSSTTTTVTAQPFSIFTAYIIPPPDFFSWLSVTDPSHRNRLRLHTPQETIDYWDSKRSMGSTPATLSGLDWTRSYSGRVYPTLRVSGSGPVPVSSGSYTGQSDALLVITIGTGGALDTATFTWQIDDGAYSSGAGVTTSGSEGTVLPLGIGITWPTGVYVSGTVYVVRLSSVSSATLPRFELYPHATGPITLPALYSTYTPDIASDTFVLPRPLDPDVIKTGVLAKMARQFPGTDSKRNPFSQIGRAQALEAEFGAKLLQCSIMDDSIIETNVMDTWPEAPLPWMADKYGQSQTEDYSYLYGIY
jgi:hypothetical protein